MNMIGQGLYRVSGVKSKVEKICQAFENGADLVDLTDIHPNVIANVLKLYLRQLPESLLTSKLYPEFIRFIHLCHSFYFIRSIFLFDLKKKKNF